jgi:hypothetical protein
VEANLETKIKEWNQHLGDTWMWTVMEFHTARYRGNLDPRSGYFARRAPVMMNMPGILSP